MLTGIDPRMTPDLLYVPAPMGHGDDIVIADGDAPAAPLITSRMPLDASAEVGALPEDVVFGDSSG